MKRPPNIVKGDKIGIAAPARKVSKQELEIAFSIIEKQGYQVYYEPSLFDVDNQFAGDDETRAAYMQQLMDDDEVKAIIAARGGYGSVRIIDLIDFSSYKRKPKWVIGYSDMTVFHSHINRNYGIQTLLASMLLNFPQNSEAALFGLFKVLEGEDPKYTINSYPLNTIGHTKGHLTGGNLSVLYSLIGSNSFPETRDKILFIEDLDEYLYHIDRMMTGLKRAGVFEGLKGLIVGGMTDMNDNLVPFGKTPEEIIADTVRECSFPVCFNFPAGHIDDNRPLIMGAEVELAVRKDLVDIHF